LLMLATFLACMGSSFLLLSFILSWTLIFVNVFNPYSLEYPL
jgi:hypothetical protein